MANSSDLENVVLFKGLPEPDLQAILRISEMEAFDKGDMIFEEGTTGEVLYIVLNGKVRVSRQMPLGGEEALAVLASGQAFGEMSVFEENVVHSASAVAHEDCFVLVLEKALFKQLLEENLPLANTVLWNVVRLLSDRLRATNDKMMFLTTSGMF